MGFKLMAGAVASCALIGVAVGVGIIYGSLLISIGRNPSQRDELLRYAFIGFSLVEVSGLIGLVISLLLLFGFDGFLYHLVHIYPVTHKLLVTELLLLTGVGVRYVKDYTLNAYKLVLNNSLQSITTCLR